MLTMDYALTIDTFLLCPTPTAWITAALAQQEILLIDHAQCEKKAASSALSMIYRYPDRTALLQKMSRLAREELRHFEQVLKFIVNRGWSYRHLTPSRYAGSLRKHLRTSEPEHLIDSLILGAFIEARSCERFATLAPHVDTALGKFYQGLLASESRHFLDYLTLAERYSNQPLGERIDYFAEIEAELINAVDPEFRFHSGVPA